MRLFCGLSSLIARSCGIVALCASFSESVYSTAPNKFFLDQARTVEILATDCASIAQATIAIPGPRNNGIRNAHQHLKDSSFGKSYFNLKSTDPQVDDKLGKILDSVVNTGQYWWLMQPQGKDTPKWAFNIMKRFTIAEVHTILGEGIDAIGVDVPPSGGRTGGSTMCVTVSFSHLSTEDKEEFLKTGDYPDGHKARWMLNTFYPSVNIPIPGIPKWAAVLR